MQLRVAVHDKLHDKHRRFPLLDFSSLLEQGKRWHWRLRTTGHEGIVVPQMQKKQKYTYNVQTCKELYRLA